MTNLMVLKAKWSPLDIQGLIWDIVSDGTYIYALVIMGYRNPYSCYLVKIDPTTMTEVSRITYTNQSFQPDTDNLIYCDGNYIYLSIIINNGLALVKINPSNMSEVGRYTPPSNPTLQGPITGDGTYIYYSIGGDDIVIYKILASNMTLSASWTNIYNNLHGLLYGLTLRSGVLNGLTSTIPNGGGRIKVDSATMLNQGNDSVLGRPVGNSSIFCNDGTWIYGIGYTSARYIYSVGVAGYTLSALTDCYSINYTNGKLLGVSSPNGITALQISTNDLSQAVIWNLNHELPVYHYPQSKPISMGSEVYAGGYDTDSIGSYNKPVLYQLIPSVSIPSVETDPATSIS